MHTSNARFTVLICIKYFPSINTKNASFGIIILRAKFTKTIDKIILKTKIKCGKWKLN